MRCTRASLLVRSKSRKKGNRDCSRAGSKPELEKKSKSSENRWPSCSARPVPPYSTKSEGTTSSSGHSRNWDSGRMSKRGSKVVCINRCACWSCRTDPFAVEADCREVLGDRGILSLLIIVLNSTAGSRNFTPGAVPQDRSLFPHYPFPPVSGRANNTRTSRNRNHPEASHIILNHISFNLLRINNIRSF